MGQARRAKSAISGRRYLNVALTVSTHYEHRIQRIPTTFLLSRPDGH